MRVSQCTEALAVALWREARVIGHALRRAWLVSGFGLGSGLGFGLGFHAPRRAPRRAQPVVER